MRKLFHVWIQYFKPCMYDCRCALLKVSHDGISCEIAKLMHIPMNTLCYLIKLMPLVPSGVFYSPFVALSIFVVLSNFCRIIKLLSSWGFKPFFLGVYISLVISQDIPSCETFSRVAVAPGQQNMELAKVHMAFWRAFSGGTSSRWQTRLDCEDTPCN